MTEPPTPRERLHAATAVVLDPDASPAKLRDATQVLAALGKEFSGLDATPATPPPSQGTPTAHGVALGATYAAQCIVDIKRTQAFCGGLEQALQAQLERFGGPIQLLYVGCGPYATLVLPLLTRYSAEQVQITLLDLHPRTLRHATAVFGAAGASELLAEAVCADATEWDPGERGPFHLAVCEAMQAALIKEPHVAITRNLAPRLVPGGLWLPRSIRVRAVLIDHGREWDFSPGAGDKGRVDFGLCFELRPDGEQDDCEVVVPPAEQWGDAPMLFTDIDVFGEHRLGPYDSGLTTPMAFPDGVAVLPGRRLRFRYESGPMPGLRYEVVPA